MKLCGLPDVSIKEAKERVKAAIKNSGEEFFSRKIVVNLAPADSRKEGSGFDLPIAIGILMSMGVLNHKKIYERLKKTVLIGELSLNGKINKVNGILPITIEAAKLGITHMILPRENAKEASIIKQIQIVPVSSLEDVIAYLEGNYIIPKIENDIFPFQNPSSFLDFAEVKGQENVKRAIEIAAAGGHNCVLIRCASVLGKTMMAKRLPTILPEMTFDEALEVTKIHSIAGLLSQENPMITQRPFRSPHHTISPTSLVGGGRMPKPRRNQFSTPWRFISR